jgi:hypothetical protein
MRVLLLFWVSRPVLVDQQPEPPEFGERRFNVVQQLDRLSS